MPTIRILFLFSLVLSAILCKAQVAVESDSTSRAWIDQAHGYITAGRLAEADSLLQIVSARGYRSSAHFERTRIDIARGDSAAYCNDLFWAWSMLDKASRDVYKSACMMHDSAAFAQFGLDPVRYSDLPIVVRDRSKRDTTCDYTFYDQQDSMRLILRVHAGDTLYMYTDHSAEFMGGQNAMYTFFSKHMKYPDMEYEAGISGKVYVAFQIGTDGALSHIRVLNSISPGLDAEALRMVRSMPAWQPGTWRGKPVRFGFILPVNFLLR